MLKKLLTSRKTIIGVLLLLSATLLTYFGQMTTEQWIEIAKWIYGIFVAGNVASKFTGKEK
jgi:hypothetical protein